MLYGVQQTLVFTAWDLNADQPLSDDESNMTIKLTRDGVTATATNAPAAISGRPGDYTLVVTAAEAQCLVLSLGGTSTTENAYIIPQQHSVVRLPNAAPGANGGLPTVDANNNIHGLQPGTGTGQVNPSGGKVPATLASSDVTGNVPADVEQWKGSTAPAMTGDAYARLGAPAGASVSADIAAVNAKTTNLPGSPAAVGSAMTLADGAITQAKISGSPKVDLVDAPNSTALTAIGAALVSRWAEIDVEFDDNAGTDTYLVRFMQDGVPVATGSVTTPCITVVDAATGDKIIDTQTLVAVGSNAPATFKYVASGGEVLIAGEACVAVVSGTISATPITRERSLMRNLVTS